MRHSIRRTQSIFYTKCIYTSSVLPHTMETGYTIDQVMTRDVLMTTPETSIRKCAKMMAGQEVGSIVIAQHGKVIGILTEQDLSRKVLALDLNPDTTTAKDIMEEHVYTTTPEKDVYYAMVDMGKLKIKHLPVVQNEKLVGIISFKDVIAIQPDLIDLVEFKSTMRREEIDFSS